MSRWPLLALAALAASAPAAGSPEDGLPGAAPDTVAFASRHHLALSLPRILWTWAVYPLGQATIYAEREELPKRARELFVNAAGTFGLFPQVQLGGETGHGLAARLFHTDFLGGERQLEALYVLSAAARQRAEWLLRDPRLGDGGLWWGLTGQYLRTDHDDATVNGAHEGRPALGEGLFSLERIDAVATLGWRSNPGPLEEYTPALGGQVRAGVARRDQRALAENRPDLRGRSHTAAAAALAGVGQPLAYAWAGVRLAWDDRDATAPVRELVLPVNHQLPGRVLLERDGLYHSFRNLAYPEGGGLAEITLDAARGTDRVAFARLGAEVQRFRTLFWRERVLAARARLDKLFPTGDGIVPYDDLPTLGGSQRLRGDKRGALRGEGALLLALEYRWPVWDTWNGFLSWEEGRVFDDLGDLDRRFTSSVAGGIALRTQTAFLVSLRVAHSARQRALVGFSLETEL